MPALVAASRIVAPAQLKARAAPARRVVAVHAVASAKHTEGEARFPLKTAAVAGLVALQLAGAAAPAFAGDVFDDRAAQKAALLAAAREKAAAQAQAQAPPPAPVTSSSFVAKDDFKDQDVRMQGVRETGADETYVASTYDPNEAPAAAPEPVAAAVAPAPEPEPEPEPANVTEGGGLFGIFGGGGAPAEEAPAKEGGKKFGLF